MNPFADCAAAKSHDNGCSRRSSDAIAVVPVDEEIAKRKGGGVRETTERDRGAVRARCVYDERCKFETSLHWALQHVDVLHARLWNDGNRAPVDAATNRETQLIDLIARVSVLPRWSEVTQRGTKAAQPDVGGNESKLQPNVPRYRDGRQRLPRRATKRSGTGLCRPVVRHRRSEDRARARHRARGLLR